jgi:hypothetical protein
MTTNFTKRKYKHHYNSANEKSTHYNLKVYQFIRLNGGWENWDMILVEEYPCDNYNQALARERHWYEELNGDLNSILPIRTEEESKELPKIYLKEYQEINKTTLSQKKKEKYEQNKVAIRQKVSEKYQENKAEILAKQRERQHRRTTPCECGGVINSSQKQRHLNSKMHIAFEASK